MKAFDLQSTIHIGDVVEFNGRLGTIESRHLFGGYKLRYNGSLETTRVYPAEVTKVDS